MTAKNCMKKWSIHEWVNEQTSYKLRKKQKRKLKWPINTWKENLIIFREMKTEKAKKCHFHPSDGREKNVCQNQVLAKYWKNQNFQALPWECQMVHAFQRPIWQHKLKKCLTFDSRIPLSRIHTSLHICISRCYEIVYYNIFVLTEKIKQSKCLLMRE